MRVSGISVVVLLTAAIFASGCEKESSVDKALDNAQDALNIREHEQLKDAGEDLQDAAHEAAEGVKDAVNEATDGS